LIVKRRGGEGALVEEGRARGRRVSQGVLVGKGGEEAKEVICHPKNGNCSGYSRAQRGCLRERGRVNNGESPDARIGEMGCYNKVARVFAVEKKKGIGPP